jgi:hypothetical protein
MNLILDAKVNLEVEWIRDDGNGLQTVPRR